MVSSKRIPWLDYARVFAILCVVLVHTTECLYSLTYEELPLLPIFTQFGVITTFTVGRLGVPFFLMISGYLLLDREYSFESTVKFYKNNVLPLFIVSSIWFIIYDIFLHFCLGHEINLIKICLNVFYVLPVSISHAWYLPTIIGLYICIPLIANMLKNIDLRILIIPILLVMAFLFARTDLNAFLFVKTGNQLGSEIDFPFVGGVYGLYLILGFLIKKIDLNGVKTLWLSLITTISFILVIILQLFSFSNGVRYTVWYNSILLLIVSVALFILFSRIKLNNNVIVNVLSKYSFSIYLIHNMIIITLSKIFDMTSGIINYIITYTTAILLSLAISFIINRISHKRILSKYLLYLK